MPSGLLLVSHLRRCQSKGVVSVPVFDRLSHLLTTCMYGEKSELGRPAHGEPGFSLLPLRTRQWDKVVLACFLSPTVCILSGPFISMWSLGLLILKDFILMLEFQSFKMLSSFLALVHLFTTFVSFYCTHMHTHVCVCVCLYVHAHAWTCAHMREHTMAHIQSENNIWALILSFHHGGSEEQTQTVMPNSTSFPFPLSQRFSTFLKLGPFNSVPHVMVTHSCKIVFIANS